MRPMVFLALAACATARPTMGPQSPRLSRVPVLDERAEPVDLVAMAAGRPMVIDLFATWCDACRPNLPRMNDLARGGHGLLVVVGIDVGEERTLVDRWTARQGIEYPVYTDPELRFQDSMGETALPLILVVDAQGRIAHRGAGFDAETIASIRDLVEESATAKWELQGGR
jgi:cytochrome c biogenesis protein CcmG/thiol:disulfide interchange protein DsbE